MKQLTDMCVALLVWLFLAPGLMHAQNAADMIRLLHSVNQAVADKACNADSAAAISNRAMNVFMADKTGYLPGSGDLSYYTNYAAFNTSEGKLSVNHNFQPATGNDASLHHFFSFGLDMTIANAYAQSFLDKRFENELGISVRYTFAGRVKTRFRNCSAKGFNQKQRMDALRAALVQQLSTEILTRENNFEKDLEQIDPASLPAQDTATAKKNIQQQFNRALAATSTEAFVTRQAALLTETAAYRFITTHWTSAGVYLPIFFPKYLAAASLVTPFSTHHPYPLNITVSHTRLLESSSIGRLFFSLNGNLLLNNSKLNYGLEKADFTDYRLRGGTDTLSFANAANEALYLGKYKNFLTPSISVRLVYFPVRSHVGVSAVIEQNTGYYHNLNAKLGVPVILVNSNSTPAVTIECFLLVFNLSHQGVPSNKQGKTSLGISVGIPFSRIMY